MPDARATVTIAAKDEASAALAKIGTTGAKAGNDLNKGFGAALESVTGVSLASLTAAGAIAGVGMAIKASLDETLQWADQMDKLARNTGMTTAEASKLAVVAGDFGIKTNTLEMALKALNKQGKTLSIETLSDMARQYQALPPGVERLTFATKNFGRSAQEMTEILSQTPEKLMAMGLAAERSGKIMNEQSVEAAQNLKIELAQLNDQVDGLKIGIGGPLVSALTSAFTTADQLFKLVKIGNVEFGEMTGQISHATAEVMTQEIVQGRSNDTLAEGNETRFTAIAALQQYVPLLNATTGAYDSMIPAVEASTRANDGHTAALEAAGKAAALEASMMGELTAKMIFQTAAAGENSTAQLEIARAMGLVDEATLSGIGKIQALKDQFDAGTITLANYVYQLGLIKNGIDGLNDKTVNVNVHTNYTQYGSEDFGGAGGGGGTVPPGPDDTIIPPVGGGGGMQMVSHPTANNGSTTANLTQAINDLPAMLARAVRDAVQMR